MHLVYILYPGCPSDDVYNPFGDSAKVEAPETEDSNLCASKKIYYICKKQKKSVALECGDNSQFLDFATPQADITTGQTGVKSAVEGQCVGCCGRINVTTPIELWNGEYIRTKEADSGVTFPASLSKAKFEKGGLCIWWHQEKRWAFSSKASCFKDERLDIKRSSVFLP